MNFYVLLLCNKWWLMIFTLSLSCWPVVQLAHPHHTHLMNRTTTKRNSDTRSRRHVYKNAHNLCTVRKSVFTDSYNMGGLVAELPDHTIVCNRLWLCRGDSLIMNALLTAFLTFQTPLEPHRNMGSRAGPTPLTFSRKKL